MQFELMQSVYNRWNAAGLDESIAPLYASGEGRARSQSTGGSPEGTAAPRAEYFISKGPPNAKSKSSRVYTAVCVIQVWSGDSNSAGTHGSSIESAFINADEAGMTMTGGDILETEDGGGFVHKEDDAVFLTQQTILIHYRIVNAVPAA